MSGIKQPITDLLTLLRTIPVTNGDGNNVVPVVRIWNNQITRIKEGQLESFPMPALFVELSNTTFENIGQGFRSGELNFKVHIAHEFYDAQDGTFEQDLTIFDLRDKVIGYLSGISLTACSPLEATGENQDYDHDNIYHYIVDFTCNFTDSTASKEDLINPYHYINSNPPTNLIINEQISI